MGNSLKAQHSDLENAILQTVVYADVFEYPLTLREIHRYLTGIQTTKEAVEQTLRKGLLSNIGAYYTLPGREELISIRCRRELIAEKMWPQAILFGRMIGALPFVRMAAVTGSLAMNNVDGDPDIDYLLVTVPGRLWMARALALAVARLAALRRVRLCPNYLVTERAMIFPDQTLYAAHELAQMVPVYGMDVYQRLCNLNRWKARFLPNAEGLPPVMEKIGEQNLFPRIKPALESILAHPPSAWFERWEMQRKIQWLAVEQQHSPESSFGADYCKGHNLRHGERTERLFRERLDRIQLELPA